MFRKMAPFFRIFFLFAVLLLPACASKAKQAKLDQLQQELEQKKARFAELVKDLSSRVLLSGTTGQTVRNIYGEPDDSYQSGSAVSSFEIWTYEPILMEGRDEIASPIRLYFDNGRLVSWTY